MLEHFRIAWNVIYAAKDLAADPNGPKSKVTARAPSFSSNTSRAATSRARRTTIISARSALSRRLQGRVHVQAAAMLNALQAPQLLGEFRGIFAGPSATDWFSRWGTRIRIEESSWTPQSAGLLQHERKRSTNRACAGRC